MTKDVLVVGSANMDYLVRVAKTPAAGQTVLAERMDTAPGGKGANQAVAAARLGARVRLVASVGDDADGRELVRRLGAAGVDVSMVEYVARSRTGLAIIMVDTTGENRITVVPGANHAADISRVQQCLDASRTDAGRIIVMQGECKAEVTGAVARAMVSTDRLVLNLAPFMDLSTELISQCDPIILNQTEASEMTAIPVADAEAGLLAVRQLARTSKSAVITLGAFGAAWYQEGRAGVVRAVKVDHPLDTTGAGDAFVGAVAAELADGKPLSEAVSAGVIAGTYSVRGRGAQSSYATRDQLAGVSMTAI
jgi:ribokinase